MAYQLLVVDDSVTMHKVVQIAFAFEDFAVQVAGSGQDGLLRAKENKPQVALIDVGMPGMDGYAVCQALKSDPATADVLVMLLGNAAEPIDEARAQQAGASGHLLKPFETQALIDRVKTLVGAPITTVAQVRPGTPGGAAPAPARPAGPVFTPSPAPAARPAAPAFAPPAAAPPAFGAAPGGAPNPFGAPPAPRPASAPFPAPAAPPASPFGPPPGGAAPRPAAPMPTAAPAPGGFAPAPPRPTGAPVPAASPFSPPPSAAPAPPPRPAAPAPTFAPPAGGFAQPAPAATPGFPAPGPAFGAPAAPAPAPAPSPAPAQAQSFDFGAEVAAAPAPAPAPAAPARAPAPAPAAAAGPIGPEEAAIRGLAKETIERIAWEVVPELAEAIIREYLAKNPPRGT